MRRSPPLPPGDQLWSCRPLAAEVMAGDAAAVEALLARGASPHDADARGNSLLHVAGTGRVVGFKELGLSDWLCR